MLFRFFESQKNHATSKDWVTTVRTDLKEFKIESSFEEIKLMKKYEYNKIVKHKIEMHAKNQLEEKQACAELCQAQSLAQLIASYPHQINEKTRLISIVSKPNEFIYW